MFIGTCTGCKKRICRHGQPEGRPFCSHPCYIRTVRRTDTLKNRFFSRIKKSLNSCWIWQGTTLWNGYGTLHLGTARGKADKPVYAHRVSWEIHHGPIGKGFFVCHHCDDRGCVNPAHLFLGTQGDNIVDMMSKGRSAKGAAHSQAKLTENDVIKIRQLIGKFRQKHIAIMFRVHPSQISNIIRGKYWTHV